MLLMNFFFVFDSLIMKQNSVDFSKKVKSDWLLVIEIVEQESQARMSRLISPIVPRVEGMIT